MQSDKPEVIHFTREAFYEKVWSEPATRLAKELGCSDVMIAKTCKAYKIPKPYPGYWAKLEYGKKPKRNPLPKNDDPAIQSLSFYRGSDDETVMEEPEVVFDPDIQQMLDRARRLKPVEVKSKPGKLHPLVAATRECERYFARPFSEQMRMARPDIDETLDMSVGKESVTRALCILDALVKRVEQIGGSIEFKPESYYRERKHPGISFGQDDYQRIRIREKQNQVRVPASERKHTYRRVKYQPTGLLIIDAGPSYTNSILLKDTPKSRRIEDGLNDMIISMIRAAGYRRIKRREEEEARRRWQEKEAIRKAKEAELQQRRDELRQRQEAEQARVDDLVNQAECWRKSQNVRHYLAAAKKMLVAKHGVVPQEGELADYITWAYQQADRLDPLSKSPQSILDESI